MELSDAIRKAWEKNHRHVLVTGGIGMGKTALLKNLAGTVQNPIPIYIDLTCAHEENYVFRKILQEYCGAVGTEQAEAYRETLTKLFDKEKEGNPSYLLLLDSLDNADKEQNPDLHKELQTLAECRGIQIVLAVPSLEFLRNRYYFPAAESFQEYQILPLEEERVYNALKEAGINSKTVDPGFLALLRRPFFLFRFLELAKANKNVYEMQSSYDLFDALSDQEIQKTAIREGRLDQAEYAFSYLLPALACELDQVAFSHEALQNALLKAYFDTDWHCGDFDRISTGVINRAKKGLNTEEYRDFTRRLQTTLRQEYAEKIFLPAGFLLKDESGFYRFADRSWLRYFEARHMQNEIQRSGRSRLNAEELNRIILGQDDKTVSKRTPPFRILPWILCSIAIIACIVGVLIYTGRLPPQPTDTPIPDTPAVTCDTPIPEVSAEHLEITGKPSTKDLEEIGSKIEYPLENEFFSEYKYATVRAPGGHSVFGFGSADHAGSKYTVLDGEKVVILAERKGYSCVIVLSEEKQGRWINSEYLEPAEEDLS